jgi:hypothetical protein
MTEAIINLRAPLVKRYLLNAEQTDPNKTAKASPLSPVGHGAPFRRRLPARGKTVHAALSRGRGAKRP